MQAETPIDDAQLVVAVALDRDAAQQDEATAVLELVADLGQRAGEARDQKILARELLPAEPATLDGAQRGVELVMLGGADRVDPIAGAGEIRAAPDLRPLDRPHRRHAHHFRSF
jgi:hypothetical protein